ncbi:unnamed protein product [Haemonchus placei]|uniref:Transposase n=1 Tax=Haemonchus placei TaxID=6290 RepID=A0A0N4WHV5_HAEPC|nr:unnamed protein product [Haemonchus placei]
MTQNVTTDLIAAALGVFLLDDDISVDRHQPSSVTSCQPSSPVMAKWLNDDEMHSFPDACILYVNDTRAKRHPHSLDNRIGDNHLT